MRIRKYESGDVPAILKTWERATRLAHPFLEEDFLDQERKNIPELYLPNAVTWVAEVDGAVIGFIALLGNEIGGLFVEPSYHGTGIGRALVDKVQTDNGTLEVEVFSENSIGRRFYTRYGFVEMEEKLHELTGQKLLRLKCTEGS
ncbi:putative N-acetyltransferase YjaB [Thalassoglobus neptunius]|uniref:Putative N-acetyltransferase YjaB n=1 Tax=Thalassoglobus neptunius TaxID=1938619 RepID=A0A5C5VY13_9PLAN|nr:GNAT family N-acetyltransferase [Thalassoglobus neptunius]TWT42609.1 putative N-acetyltransferase YjaB [Thalassoglobus neptunius]